MPKASIVVITYNADWNKLKTTINSILIQTDVDYEIVFADDGSKIKWNEEISRYIPANYKYTFADSDTNVGTVGNALNGVKKAQGTYIKLISPGDCFNGCRALKEWIDFMEERRSDFSFCDAIYYKYENSQAKILRTKASPKNRYIYQNYNKRKIFVDYLLANDTVLGAAVLAKKSTMLEYLNQIDGRVKYAEDYMIRLMVYDGEKIDYINQKYIWYEYGDGISTTADNKWSALLHKDYEAIDAIILERNQSLNKQQKKYKKMLTEGKDILILHKVKKVMLFPMVILYRIQMKFFYHRTPQADMKEVDYLSNLHIEK